MTQLKKVSYLFAAAFLVAFFAACKEKQPVASANLYPIPEASGTAYNLDVQKSVVKWIGRKVIGDHNGTVKLVSGKVYAQDDKITGGVFTLDMNTIDVKDLEGEKKADLEDHLKTEDFFQTNKFPTATFTISSATANEAGKTEIKGNLEMLGITHGIDFKSDVEFAENKPNSATANVSIDRQKWGIVYKGKADNLISDTIELSLELFTE